LLTAPQLQYSMVLLSYPGENYNTVLQSMAAFFQVKPENNKIRYHNKLGKGFFFLINLPMDMQAWISEFELSEDLYMIRQKSDSEYFNLRLEIISNIDNVTVIVNENELGTSPAEAYTYLNSSRYSIAYKAKKGTKAKTLNLRFTREALSAVLGKENNAELLTFCVTNNIDKELILPADVEMLKIFSEMMEIPENDPQLSLKMFARSLSFTERFFEAMQMRKRNTVSDSRAVTQKDIELMAEVEKMITENLNELPPTQEELASKVFMSVSKLKYTFKAVYGTSIYNYYQKARMEKALLLLQQGKSITETSWELGFKDQNNFSKNFKREFNLPPGKVRKLNAV